MATNNKVKKLDETNSLDKGLDFAEQFNTCRRCLEKLGDDYKTYKNNLCYCKSCSVLVDHWLNGEFREKSIYIVISF